MENCYDFPGFPVDNAALGENPLRCIHTFDEVIFLKLDMSRKVDMPRKVDMSRKVDTPRKVDMPRKEGFGEP